MKLKRIVPVAVLVPVFSGCGGFDYTDENGTYVITPSRVTVAKGQSVTIQASPFPIDTTISWSIRESGGGRLSRSGNVVRYTAPNDDGTYHVEADYSSGPTLVCTIRVPEE